MKRRLVQIAALGFLLSCCHASTQAAGLLIAEGGFGGVLEQTEHDVKVTINNGIAVTEVHQTFRNTEQRQVEALYVFPVPKGASVSNFSMWINGKEMIGEVVEKKRARQVYESYKQTRQDPGLLEQTDHKTFEMRIFPINAEAEQRIKLTYCQQLDIDGNWGTYVYPLGTAGRRGLDDSVRGRFALNVDIRNNVPITKVESPSHRSEFVMAKYNDQYWQASLETGEGRIDRDVVVAFKQERTKTGFDLLASRRQSEDGYFMLTLTAGKELEQLDEPMDYVFVLDISGSMAQDRKLAMSVESIAAFVEALGPKDRFDLLTFNVQPKVLFGSLNSVDDQSKATAQQFLRASQAGGGTVLQPALELAYRYAQQAKDRSLNIVILSDGMTEQRERAELVRLLGQRPAGSRVFCIGVGNDVNRPLLEQLAQRTGGLASFISRGDDFNRQAQAFRRKLTRPVMSDVRIDIQGGGVYGIEPNMPTALFHGVPIRLFGRYQKAGPVQLTLSATVNGRAVRQELELQLPKQDQDNPQIERMWALHRVDRLLKEGDANSPTRRPELIRKVIDLGEAYSIVTEYTSFIVLENDAEYRRWSIARKNALRVDRDRAARDRLQNDLANMRSRALKNLGPTSPDAEAASPMPTGDRSASSRRTRSRDVNVTPPSRRYRRSPGSGSSGGSGGSGGSGIGAIDPVSLTALAVTVGAGIWLNQRNRRTRPKPKTKS